MKRALLGFACATVLTMVGTKANAQITGVDVIYAGDSVTSSCLLPATTAFIYEGNVSGTIGTTDSVTVNVNWGDGSDTTYRQALMQNGFWGYVPHTYYMSGSFTNQITVTTDNGFTDVMQSSNPILLSNNCAPLTGKLYVDANGNCAYDAGEITFTWAGVYATDGIYSYYGYTDANGDYTIGLPPGSTYTLTPYAYYNSLGYLSPSCPSSGTATVTVVGGNNYVQDFAYSCSPNGNTVDAHVYGWAWNWRPGFDRSLSIEAGSNNLCTAVPAVVTVTLPAELSYSSTMWGTAPTVSGNTLTWNVAALSDINTLFSYMNVMCDVNATLGDTLCVTVNVVTTPTDSNSTNNTYVICAEVNNSMDPNQKGVSPAGNGPQGYVANGEEFTYLVDFQNCGNDVAYTVTIEDAIDSDLDINTMHIISASHAMIPYREPGGVMKFRFDNINLPDSNSNEPASHGYVMYSVKAKPNLAPGTQMTNTANIYFDYNEAIITNTTLNTINIPTAIENVSNKDVAAAIYPNPANGNINIEVKNIADYTAELYDITGRQVNVAKGNNNKAVLNVAAQASGTYLLRIVTSEGKVLTTKVSVQH